MNDASIISRKGAQKRPTVLPVTAWCVSKWLFAAQRCWYVSAVAITCCCYCSSACCTYKTLPLTSKSSENPCWLFEQSSETCLMNCFTGMASMSSVNRKREAGLNHLLRNSTEQFALEQCSILGQPVLNEAVPHYCHCFVESIHHLKHNLWLQLNESSGQPCQAGQTNSTTHRLSFHITCLAD